MACKRPLFKFSIRDRKSLENKGSFLFLYFSADVSPIIHSMRAELTCFGTTFGKFWNFPKVNAREVKLNFSETLTFKLP